MTLTEGTTRVRHLLDQTDNTNTQFDDTNFIAEALNQGRRLFARILPDSFLPGLRTTSSLAPSSGHAAFASDYLRDQDGVRVLVDTVFAVEIPPEDQWRLKYLEANDLTKSANGDKYYWKDDDGIDVLPTAASAVLYPYIKVPADLGGGANTDLPEDIEDLTVDFAFERCMRTKRGDLELAVSIAKDRGYIVRAMYANI